MLQIAFVENLAKSQSTYPKISIEHFINNFLAQQTNDEEKARLTRPFIELALVKVKRGADPKADGASLCRGEFLETLLRLCFMRHPRSFVSDYLEDFLFIYVMGQYQNS